MASFKQYTASGGASEAFSINTFSSDEIKVYVDNVLKTAATHYNITSYTTSGGTVTWTTGNVPNGVVVRIVRDTGVLTSRATYAAGSSVKADDLNNNQTQVLRSLEEQDDQLIQTYDVQDSAITTAKIKADNITSALIADDQIDSEHYAAGSIDLEHMSANSVDSDQYVDGSIDSVHIANDQINSQHYAAGSIDTEHIADSQVTTAKIAADAVTNAKIADNSIDSEHYVDGSIDTAHLADNSVTGAKLAAGTIGTTDLADSAVTTAKIADANVTTAKIAGDAVNGTKIADDSINSEHYVDGSIDTAHIADSQVTTAKIADANVTTAKITDLNVTTAKIAADAITGAKIADDAVDSEHLAADSIDAEHYAAGSVDTTALGADAVTGAKIADDAIDSEHYVDGSIDTAHIANSAVTAAKLGTVNLADLTNVHTATPSDGQVLKWINSNSRWEPAADAGAGGATLADGDYGDITVSSSGAVLTIDNDVISGAKIADDAVGSEHIEVLDAALQFGDSVKAQFGTGNDLEIFHNGNHSFIQDAGTGNLYIDSIDGNIYIRTNQSESAISIVENGTVELYYDNSKKFQTEANGIQIFDHLGIGVASNTGSCVYIKTPQGSDGSPSTRRGLLVQESAWSDGNIIEAQGSTGNTIFKVSGSPNDIEIPNDTSKLKLGTGGDLEIYHDGSHSYIKDTGTGNLKVQSDSSIVTASTKVQFESAAEDEVLAVFYQNDRCELYYDNSKKFETTSAGVSVTGSLSLTDDLNMEDGDQIEMGTGNDFKIFHSTDNYLESHNDTEIHITAYTGGSTENMAKFKPNGAVELYHNNSKKLETISTGAKVKYALQIEEESGSEYYQFVTNSYGGLEVQNETTKIAEFTDANTLELQDNLKFAVAGKGIDFSTTTDATGMSSELFDDYEEGTFTITARDAVSGGNATTTNANCFYTKVGRLVTVQVRIQNINTTGMTSGNVLYMTGLPFTSADTTGNRSTASCYAVNMNPASSSDVKEHLNAIMTQNTSSTYFAWSRTEGESSSTLKVADVEDDEGDIEFTMTYTA